MTLLLIKEPQKNDRHGYIPGIISLFFVAVNYMGFIILETFRGNQSKIMGGVSIGQVAAFVILVGCVLIIYNKFSKLQADDEISKTSRI